MFPPIKKWVSGLCLVLVSIPVHAEPLTRNEAVQLSLENNPEIRVAYHTWAVERARVLQAWAPPQPELELEYDGMSGAFDFGTFVQKDIGIVQTLEFPAKWWLRGKATTRQAQAVQLAVYETTRQDVALRVHQAYDRVLADTQIMRFSEENVRLSEGFLNRAKIRFVAGDVPKLDVMRAEVALGRQQIRLTTTQNALSISQAALNTLLNRVVDAPLALADSLSYASDKTDFDALLTYALAHRTELQGTERSLQSDQVGRSLAWASAFPDISLGVFRQTVVSPVGQQKFWRAGIAIELPVWAMFRQRGEISEANAQKARATAEHDVLKLRIIQGVDVALRNYQAADQQLELMRQRVLPTAEGAYDMARRSYDEGKATYLDMLETQRDLIDTRTEYVETLFDYRSSLAQLARATGSILNTKEIEK
jgi:outer membrane protein, heavy metal efflux system